MQRPEAAGTHPDPGEEGTAAGRIEVAYALPERQAVIELPLPASGLSARAAIEQSGLLTKFPELATQPLVFGIFGVVCDGERRLRDGDRVEIYRPLRQDPRASRRERAASTPRQGRRR